MPRMTKEQLRDYTSTLQRFKEENTKQVTDERIYAIMYLLHRHETTLNRLYTDDCNYGLDEKQKRKVESTEKRVKSLADELGLPVKFNGDPRGAAIMFYLPSKQYNNWDGESWRIFW